MLYTVIPAEFVFSDKFKPQPPVETFALKNGILETRRTSSGREITWLFSTDLKDYLNPRYTIGNLID